MSEKQKDNSPTVKEALGTLVKAANMDNIQKYVLGTKKNGAPRAVYDVVKDMTKISAETKKKKKKKHKHDFDDEFALYLGPKRKKKKKGKKGKKKKKNKYWRYDD